MGRLFIFFLLVTKSLQSPDVREGKYCGCYDRCERNFTVNTTIHEESKAACERGCRFYSLVLHSCQEVSSVVRARERCETSCTESYMNSTDLTACNFGCSAMRLTDGDVCAAMQHGPQDVIEFVFDESGAVIHLEEPELDDVLIDIALKKQLENSFGRRSYRRQKLPEISFTNLPISRAEHSGEEHGCTAVIRCPRFYEFYVKFNLRPRKMSTNNLYCAACILMVAAIIFTGNRLVGNHKKLWKKIFINLGQDEQEPENDLPFDSLPEKEDFVPFDKEAAEELQKRLDASPEEGLTLVIYGSGDTHFRTHLGQNNF